MRYQMRLICIFFTAIAPLGGGCLSHQATRDGSNLRRSLNEMYTDQIMDNLIQAHNNMPFVQVTYGDVTVQDNDQYGGSLGASQSLTEVLFDPIQRTYATALSPTGNASRSRTMSFVANPVTDQNDIYEAYLTFAQEPELFVVSDEDPGSAAHIVRKHCKKYYWVPTEAAPKFLELSMKTTFMRGPEAAPTGAYEANIVSVSKVENPNLEPTTNRLLREPGDLTIAYLTLSAPIPSGDATMVAKLTDGRTLRIELKRMSVIKKDGKEVPVRDGDPTTEISTIGWSPKATGYTQHDLVGAKTRIYSHQFPADAPTPAPRTLQQIKSGLNYIRNEQSTSRR